MTKIESERQKTQYSPKEFSEKYHGKRVGLLDNVGVSSGLVINGNVPQEIWDKTEAFMIPLIPGGINIFKRNKASSELAKVREKYGQDILMIMVPDDESFQGWSAQPVLVSDIGRDPNHILSEALQAISKGDFPLEQMKRCAYLATTGYTDTK